MIGGSLVVLACAAALVLYAMSDSIVFFSTPSMVAERHVAAGGRFRLGGLVQPGSLVHGDNLAISFKVADGMPKEAADALQKQGLWKEGNGRGPDLNAKSASTQGALR